MSSYLIGQFNDYYEVYCKVLWFFITRRSIFKASSNEFVEIRWHSKKSYVQRGVLGILRNPRVRSDKQFVDSTLKQIGRLCGGSTHNAALPTMSNVDAMEWTAYTATWMRHTFSDIDSTASSPGCIAMRSSETKLDKSTDTNLSLEPDLSRYDVTSTQPTAWSLGLWLFLGNPSRS